MVVAKPPGDVADAAGAPLDGGLGTFGDDATFVIEPKGKGISRRAGFELGR